MERHLLQSALRELQAFLRAPRFWATFGAVVLIFWIAGPYGTAERLAAIPRLGFWLVLHGLAWGIAVSVIVLVNTLLRGRIPSLAGRMAIGTVVAGIPVGLATEATSRPSAARRRFPPSPKASRRVSSSPPSSAASPT